MGDADNITTENEAPRAVMYTDGQDIMIAYLVEDSEIQVSIPQPTIETVVVGLFASYYVWNRVFPSTYANVLNYINHELLKSPLSTSSTTIKKFIRSRDEVLQKLDNTDKITE